MLKLAQPSSNAFHNLKCGEVFCISPAVYNVTCCLCATKMHLEQFPSHFQMQHLTLAEESINLEELERKRKSKLAKDASLLDNMTIKEEDPEDDPIKQEGFIDDEEDDKSLQQLLMEKGEARKEQNEEDDDVDVGPLDIESKLEIEMIVKRPNTRNIPRVQYNEDILEDKKDVKKLLAPNKKEAKVDKKEAKVDKKVHKTVDTQVVNIDLSKKEFANDDGDDDDRDEDNDDVDMDKDWAEDGKFSDSDSDNAVKNDPTDELPFPCLLCSRTYRSKQSLQKHNYRNHNPNKKTAKKRIRPTKENKCDECGEVFRTVLHLRGHKWKHTGIVCDICGQTFKQVGTLVRHKIRHTGIRDHKCTECEKAFFTNKELISHMKSHTGFRPYVCDICGKRCRDGGVLTLHMRRHTGERPAKCDVCGKCFFTGHDLNVHAVTHTTERPFKCDICDATFQLKKSLRVHKLRHADDRKHVCKICGKGFAQSSALNSHMRSHDAALEKPSTSEPTLHQMALFPMMLNHLSAPNPSGTTATIIKIQQLPQELLQ